jgi:hypothetical protein
MITGSDWGGSRLATAQTCKQKYYDQYLRPHPTAPGLGLIPIESKLAPTKGTLVHLGLQNYYESKIKTPEMAGDERALAAMHFAINAIKDFNIDKNMVPLLKDELISTFDQYFSKYELEDLIPIACEVPVQIRIGDFVHTGLIDMLARWEDTLCVVDHKTTSMSMDFLFKKLRLNLSMKGYAHAARSMEIAGGEPVMALINGIQFKKNKAMECEFARELIMYTDDEMDEFEATVSAIRNEIELCEKNNFWPKSGEQCVQIWGECDYRKLCMYDDPALVSTFYKTR